MSRESRMNGRAAAAALQLPPSAQRQPTPQEQAEMLVKQVSSAILVQVAGALEATSYLPIEDRAKRAAKHSVEYAKAYLLEVGAIFPLEPEGPAAE